MKFKVKPEKSNMAFMTSTFFLLIITCILWIILKEYIYFVVYFILTILLAYIYYFTSYTIKDKYLVIKLGFIVLKINYNKITNVELIKNKVKVNLKKFSLDLYPDNKDIFVAKVNSKIKRR